MAGISRCTGQKMMMPERPQTPQLVQQETDAAWEKATDRSQPTPAVGEGVEGRADVLDRGKSPQEAGARIGLKARLLDDLMLGRELDMSEHNGTEASGSAQILRIHHEEQECEYDPSPWEHEDDQLPERGMFPLQPSVPKELPQFCTGRPNSKLSRTRNVSR
eukprot:TRINITY_DN17033_c0_g1_i1.p1 TRINITY_DN17033_c0_g1~~TRINITY_DN17033_c0_g1_i1.p1  ORF type:complete len:162 (-),score=30.99 TRINITY_DN17033_c0_g1_i1:194-679(-)